MTENLDRYLWTLKRLGEQEGGEDGGSAPWRGETQLCHALTRGTLDLIGVSRPHLHRSLTAPREPALTSLNCRAEWRTRSECNHSEWIRVTHALSVQGQVYSFCRPQPYHGAQLHSYLPRVCWPDTRHACWFLGKSQLNLFPGALFVLDSVVAEHLSSPGPGMPYGVFQCVHLLREI